MSDEEKKAKKAARCKAWRIKNKDKVDAYQAAYRAKNKENIAASGKAWRSNPENKAHRAGYMAKRRSTPEGQAENRANVRNHYHSVEGNKKCREYAMRPERKEQRASYERSEAGKASRAAYAEAFTASDAPPPSESVIKSAEERGSVVLGRIDGKPDYYEYKLPCGHTREAQAHAMQIGSVLCHTCNETHYDMPSNVYLLYIERGGEQWLKLGYAKDVDHRVSKYGLPESAVIPPLAVVPFDTGYDALEYEKALHGQYGAHRLSNERAKELGMEDSGHTECYPVTLVEQLLAELAA